MRSAGILLVMVSLLLAPPAPAQQTLNLSGIRLWLERADAVRGPEGYGEDNYYTSYRISSHSYRNFTSNACWIGSDGPNCTQALDGTSPLDATAPPITAVPPSSPAPSGPYHPDVLHSTSAIAKWASCGQWLNSVISHGDTLYGFVHGEAPKPGTTGCGVSATHHKTMTLWSSPTGPFAGLATSWSNPILIIDSTLGDLGSGESGEGDCNAIQDSTYAYLFCRNPTSDTTTIARAPLTNLTRFIKYDNGWGSQPGINGIDSNLVGAVFGTHGATTSKALGTGASVWASHNLVMLLGIADASFAGLKASFTGLANLQSSKIGLTTLPDPLFVQESVPKGNPPHAAYPYGSYPKHNLYIYPSVVSLVDGTRTWYEVGADRFLLAYAFVPPYSNLSHRLLAMRTVNVSSSSHPVDPQVLVALSTYYDPNFNQYYSSTQPVAYGGNPIFAYPVGSFSQISEDALGYLPQLPAANPVSQGQRLTKLVECRSRLPWPSGHPDHLITSNSCGANYDEDTVAGYSYPSKPRGGNSVQIYRCVSSSNGTHWVSKSSFCDKAGKADKSLGWIVTK